MKAVRSSTRDDVDDAWLGVASIGAVGDDGHLLDGVNGGEKIGGLSKQSDVLDAVLDISGLRVERATDVELAGRGAEGLAGGGVLGGVGG